MTKLNSPLFIFHAAKDFFEGGTNVASKYFKTENNKPKKYDSMIHPHLCMPIVNIVFSLELSLKGLLKQTNRKRFLTHDLLILFTSLDSNIQNRIIANYQKHDVFKKYIGIKMISGDGTGADHSKITFLPASLKDEQSIKNLLNTHKNYFKQFRYLFEFSGKSEILFLFREFLNFSYSTLTILGEQLNIMLEVNKEN